MDKFIKDFKESFTNKDLHIYMLIILAIMFFSLLTILFNVDFGKSSTVISHILSIICIILCVFDNDKLRARGIYFSKWWAILAIVYMFIRDLKLNRKPIVGILGVFFLVVQVYLLMPKH